MASKRDDILDTALTLFSINGYHGVGVDRIKEGANVSKMTMYKYFPTKEILIENVLLKRDEIFRNGMSDAIKKADSSYNKIKSVFEWHQQWFAREEFYGCMFIKASEEFPDETSDIRKIAKEHKLFIKDTLQNILELENIEDADDLSYQLLITLEGLIVNANMFSNYCGVEISWKFISQLLGLRGIKK